MIVMFKVKNTLFFIVYIFSIFFVYYYVNKSYFSPEVILQNDLGHIVSENNKVISIKSENARFDISLIGGSVQNIGIKQGAKNLLDSGVDIPIQKTGGKKEIITSSKKDKIKILEDSNYYLMTIENSKGVKENEQLPSGGMQIISEDPSITFGRYYPTKVSDKEVILSLKHERGKIIKRFYVDSAVSTSIMCDIEVKGFVGENLHITTGVPVSRSMSGGYYRDVVYNESTDDVDYSKTYTKSSSLPSKDSTISLYKKINWIANRSGAYTLILDNLSEDKTGLSIRSFPVSRFASSESGIKDTAYVPFINLKKGISRFRLTSAPCSAPFLDKLSEISGGSKKYYQINSIKNIFGIVINPIIEFARILISFGHSISHSWAIGFALLICIFVVISMILSRILKKHSKITQRHIKNIRILEMQKESGYISQEVYIRKVMESLKNCKWSITLNILIPIARIFFMISMGIFFRFAFELEGSSLIPGWIDDLSKPDSLIFLQNIHIWHWIIPVRILPFLSGLFGTLRMPSNYDVPPVFKNFIMPITIGYMLFSMSSGFQIYFIVSSFFVSVGDENSESAKQS